MTARLRRTGSQLCIAPVAAADDHARGRRVARSCRMPHAGGLRSPETTRACHGTAHACRSELAVARDGMARRDHQDSSDHNARLPPHCLAREAAPTTAREAHTSRPSLNSPHVVARLHDRPAEPQPSPRSALAIGLSMRRPTARRMRRRSATHHAPFTAPGHSATALGHSSGRIPGRNSPRPRNPYHQCVRSYGLLFRSVFASVIRPRTLSTPRAGFHARIATSGLEG